MPLADLLGGFGGGFAAGSEIMGGLQDAKRQGKLAQLLQQGVDSRDQRQSALSQIARIGGQDALTNAQGTFGKMDDAARDDLAASAGQFAAIAEADPNAAAQMYPSLAQKAHAIGIPVPMTYDPKFLPAIQKLAGAAQQGPGVQSTYIDAQGNRIAIMRDGSQQTLGRNAPNVYVRDQPGLPFDMLDKINGQSIYDRQPPQGQPQPWVQNGATYQTPSGIVRINDVAPEDMAAVQADIESGGASNTYRLPDHAAPERPPARPLTTTQPDTFVPLTSDEVAQMGLPAGTVAQRNLKTGKIEFAPQGVQPQSNAPTPAQAFKIQQTARKERQMLAANDAGIDQTVKLIDSILARKGDLGGVTGMGRLGAKIPGTDWADIAAKLDTLKGRSAFGALQQMRANSPTGGALGSVSERELYLLQNAEAQLQDSQSPEALARALEEYKAALLESKRRMREGLDEFYSGQLPQSGGRAPQPGGVDDLLSKYGAK